MRLEFGEALMCDYTFFPHYFVSSLTNAFIISFQELERRAHGFYLKLCVLVDVLRSLPVEDEFSLVGNTNYVVLHGMAEQPSTLQTKLNAVDIFIYRLNMK